MKNALSVVSLLLCLGTAAFAAPDDITVDRATNVFNTSVSLSSGALRAVRLGEVGGLPTIVLNTPGSAPAIMQGSGSVIAVSTSATSLSKLGLAGAADALPTTGYPKYSLLVLTTTGALYISTETVAGSFSWVKVGAQ